jgi:hypothetical protein
MDRDVLGTLLLCALAPRANVSAEAAEAFERHLASDSAVPLRVKTHTSAFGRDLAAARSRGRVGDGALTRVVQER